ncbi:MAG: CoA-binding protein [Bacillota bacterium]|nr:CoA-binding protein [Bacillota bacterium]
MVRLTMEFFEGNQVLFIGYSEKYQAFCKQVYQAFSNNGIKVYPVNNKDKGNFDVKVYKSLEDLPQIPRTAYVLLNRKSAGKAVKELAEKGVRRILFQNTKNADQSLLEECSRLGIETIVACPMMRFGTGFHKIHGFFAGVRK